jgi:hypothetical protein
MSDAASAILLQADHVLLKPLEIRPLIALIQEKLANRDTPQIAKTAETMETAATILERTSALTIANWLERVKASPDLSHVALTDEERTEHLPRLMQDLVRRLRQPQSLEDGRVTSTCAPDHGTRRCKQGYTAAMIVEESRMLQVSIFQTLHNNLNRVNFSQLLMNVMVIADEVDWQLTQAIRGFVGEQQLPIAPIAA